MSSWSDEFIGLPFLERGRSRAGVDCYGVACVVYAAIGIELITYVDDYLGVDERAEIAGLIGGAKTSPTWLPVSDPQPRDLLIFRRGGVDCHIGLFVDRSRMLHIERGGASRIDHFDRNGWPVRAAGAFRHHQLVGAT